MTVLGFSLSEFNYSEIEFEVAKSNEISSVWINKDSSFGINNFINREEQYQYFENEFAYVIERNNCFSSLTFDSSDTRTLKGERYGGRGIGSNAGGVRCGNSDSYQIKGIGTNAFVGIGEHSSHSYGGMDLHDAIVETIYSNILDLILPIGAVKIIGLLYTGDNTANRNNIECPGALMVREKCLRPAHFIQAPNFSRESSKSADLYSDIFRARTANRQLKLLFKEDKNYILFLSRFLSKCAQQFAFCKLYGIGHRSISPSNISLDGRWLDTPLSCFVGPNVNYLANTPLKFEFQSPVIIVEELLYAYSKFNQCQLNFKPLFSYYFEQFNEYQKFYVNELLGFPPLNEDADSDESWKVIVKTILDNLANNTSFLTEKNQIPYSSDIQELVYGLYLSFTNKKLAMEHFECQLNYSELSAESLIDAFHNSVKFRFSKPSQHESLALFVKFSGILAMKKLTQLKFFHLSNSIEQTVDNLCKHNNLSGVSDTIDSYTQSAEWIFEVKPAANLTLFKNDTTEIIYISKLGNLVLTNNGVSSNLELRNFKKWLTDTEIEFVLHQYCFKQSLLTLAQLFEENINV